MIDAVLQRLAFRSDGVFSALVLDDAPRFFTLERARLDPMNRWKPIVRPGTYQCIKGVHKTVHSDPFTTFEVTGVTGHTGILFHSGNLAKDTEGCILLGQQTGYLNGSLAVLNSRLAFAAFMGWAKSRPTFTLKVIV